LPRRTGPLRDPEVILEFTAIGAIVRVSAMDPRTLTEVVIQGPAAAGRAVLERLALAKLGWALRRAEGGQSTGRPFRAG
jgi:hypothetical protein